jgi:hypothetical protein
LLVVTMLTPSSQISAVNSLPMMAASAVLVTTISSKARQRTSSAMAFATWRTGCPWPVSRAAFIRRSASSMNSWKCARRFSGMPSVWTNRSISMDLPRPTPPHM